MNIGVISDTHGNSHAVKKAVEIIDKVDFWLHAGDCSQDAEAIRKLTGLPVFAACGNCDGGSKAPVDQYPEFDTCKRKKCLEPLKLKVSRHFVFF